MAKLNQTDLITKILGTSYDGLTFGELCNKLNDSRESVRKTLHYLHKEGRIAKANDTNGITHYNLTEKGKARFTALTEGVTSSQAEIENTSVIKVSTQSVWKEAIPKKEPWEQLVAEAEQRGFAKGYAEGSKASQRCAFEDGKKAVINKLMGMLT